MRHTWSPCPIGGLSVEEKSALLALIPPDCHDCPACTEISLCIISAWQHMVYCSMLTMSN